MDGIVIGVLSLICMFGGVNITFGSGSASDGWIAIDAHIEAPDPYGSHENLGGSMLAYGVRPSETSSTGYEYASVFLEQGQKGYIPAFIDIIMNNPLIEIVTLLFLAGSSIAFLKRVIRT